jgi:hypothetical protein
MAPPEHGAASVVESGSFFKRQQPGKEALRRDTDTEKKWRPEQESNL